MNNKTSVKVPVSGDVSINTPQLGPVGGGIVMEVFLGLMFEDKHSLLNLEPSWQPAGNPNYALRDFVKYALGM